MGEVTVELAGDRLALAFTEEDGGQQTVRMAPELGLKLAAGIILALKDALPVSQGNPLSARPLLWFKNPDLEIGADKDGRVLVAFQCFTLPPISFSLDEGAAAILRLGMDEISRIPAGKRFK
jgi:hypothetical protein